MTDVESPHALEAEQAVLGAVIVNNALLDDVADVVGPADFYRDAHQRIFKHALALRASETAIDFVTLQAALKQAGDLDRVGGPVYLGQLLDGMPRTSNAAHYAQIVRDKAIRRQLVAQARLLLAEATDAEGPAAAVLEAAMQRLWAVAMHQQQGELVSAEQLVREAWPVLEELAARKGELRGVPTGLVDLDRVLGGLQRTDLVILAARPAMGKTALATTIAAAAAKRAHRVAVFSLEMGREQVLFRLVASEAQINLKRLMEGRTSEGEAPRLRHAMDTIATWPLHIDDTAVTTVADVRAKCRRLQARAGLGLVIVDYLQLMTDPRRHDSRVLELATISRGLKQIAKELRVPVLALSQLSREVERRTPPRPQLADLRDSGALEQDADVVLLLWREEEYQATPQNQGLAEVIIGKHRNGPTGAVTLAWRREVARFANAAPDDERVF